MKRRADCWLARLLISGGLALFAPGVDALDVRFENDLVTVEANDVPVQVILDELAHKKALRLVLYRRIERPATLSVRAAPIGEVLARLLDGDDSYHFFNPATGDGGVSVSPTLWIFDESSGSSMALEFYETVLMHGLVGDKKEAVRMLRDMASPQATQVLALALSDPDTRVRGAAREALAAIGDSEALAALASELTAEEVATRSKAAASIATSSDASAQAYLELALTDKDPRVRTAVVSFIGDLPGETSRAMLQKALEDPDPAVRELAVEVLEELDDEAMFHALFPAP